jgi:hypothetical protein
MEKKESNTQSRVRHTNLLRYTIPDWRKESIKRSIIRPFYQEALRTAFFTIILLIDTLLPLQLFISLKSPFNIVSSLILLGVLLYIEVQCYNAVWGKKGRWSVEKYKKALENTKEEKKDVS